MAKAKMNIATSCRKAARARRSRTEDLGEGLDHDPEKKPEV